LEANASPIKAGEHRTLIVHVRGTTGKILLEARNLAPEVAELNGGPITRHSSAGGGENSATFDVVGKKQGSFFFFFLLLSCFELFW
jgi:hypothetical protein